MSEKQKMNNLLGWTSKNINLERVIFNFSSEAKGELKKFIQSSSGFKETEAIVIGASDFPKFKSELEICREEIEYGQKFVILGSIQGLAYKEIQLYCWVVSNLL